MPVSRSLSVGAALPTSDLAAVGGSREAIDDDDVVVVPVPAGARPPTDGTGSGADTATDDHSSGGYVYDPPSAKKAARSGYKRVCESKCIVCGMAVGACCEVCAGGGVCSGTSASRATEGPF